MVLFETERLAIRRFNIQDATFMLEMLNDPDWIKNIGDRGLRTLDDAARHIRDKYLPAYDRDGYGMMVAVLKSTGESAGMVGLINRHELDGIDIGFAFLPAFRGQGLAFEGATAAVEYGRDRLGLLKLLAITLPTNKGSIRLLEKLGMEYQYPIKLESDPEILSFYSMMLACPVESNVKRQLL